VTHHEVINFKRKYFHFLAVIMFLPGYLLEPRFMGMAFSVALTAFFFMELVRYFRIPPYGCLIHEFMMGFLDVRDEGPLVASHLYLLVGCAIPIWLEGKRCTLAGASGILVLGFGDAMASIVGQRYGRRRWPWVALKTVEGTLGFIGGTFVGVLLSLFFTQHDIFAEYSWMFVVLITGLVEAYSLQNDNLTIPILFYLLVK